ncbi:MAG: hypothetical protein VW169_09185 [Rhodospirillaceae bacterium]
MINTFGNRTRENLVVAALNAHDRTCFESLLSNLAGEINADAAVIGVLSDDEASRVQTLSFLRDHEFNRNF